IAAPAHPTCRYTHTGGAALGAITLALIVGANPDFAIAALGAAVFFAILASIVLARNLAPDPTNPTETAARPVPKARRGAWWWLAVSLDAVWFGFGVFSVLAQVIELATGTFDPDRTFTDSDMWATGLACVGVMGGLLLWLAAHRNAHHQPERLTTWPTPPPNPTGLLSRISTPPAASCMSP